MKPTTLFIMAAGIGSRYQTDKNKIVFVIRPDIAEDFKEQIGNRIEAVCTHD